MDTNRHKFFMLQLLKDIFSDALLSSVMAFKGGTATMFFYNLPRFSTDLDKCLESVQSVSEKSLISDSVNASEAGEIFAATNHTDDVFTFIGI